MRQQSIGEAICRRRQELGISQEKLAEGLCEAATISRLENGRQTPSRDLVNALLQRLDLPGDRFWAVLTAEEERLEQMREDLISLSVRFQTSLEPERGRLRRESLEKLSQLEKLIGPKDRLNRQFILRTQGSSWAGRMAPPTPFRSGWSGCWRPFASPSPASPWNG